MNEDDDEDDDDDITSLNLFVVLQPTLTGRMKLNKK